MALADNTPYRPAPAPYKPASYSEPKYDDAPAQYEYAYAVNDDYSGVNFGANEGRDGYATSGKYYVLLPDGRTQTVTYTVDGYSGYVADVQYSGDYKPYKPAPAPKYAPKPAYSN